MTVRKALIALITASTALKTNSLSLKLKMSSSNVPMSRSRFVQMASASFLAGTMTTNTPPASSSTISPEQPPDTKSPRPKSNINTDMLLSQQQINPPPGTTMSQTMEETISGFFAGAALSATKTAVKYPLDTATVRLQMPDSRYTLRNLGPLFDGSLRGILPPLLSNIPGGAIFFAVKDASKTVLKQNGVSRFGATALAVAAANFPYWLVRNPTEVVKTRQQATVGEYAEGDFNTVKAFRQVYEEAKGEDGTMVDGIGGFYSGYWENLLYAYPADVIKFACYEQLSGGRKNLPPVEGAVKGAASTAVAQFLTTPLDVVRNRIMAGTTTAGEERPRKETEFRLDAYFDTLATLAREEGYQGLFAGASPRIGKAILSGAIQFATYEETKKDIQDAFIRAGMYAPK